MAEVYLFQKPGFKKRQSEKLKGPVKRYGFLIDCNILAHPKIAALNQMQDHTLFPLLVHIWGQLDAENETWSERVDIFDNWVRTTFRLSNRFDVKKRLQKLHDLGLIQIEIVASNDQVVPKLGVSYTQVTPELGSSCSEVDPQLPPLEQSETHVAVISNITNKQTKENIPTLSDTSCLPNSNFNESQNPKDPIWGDGLQLLISTGTKEGQARSFLGGLVKTYGKEAVQNALEQAKYQNAVEPKGYLIKVLKSQSKDLMPSAEDEERHRWEENRKIWLRMPFAVPVDRDNLDEIPVFSTGEYEADINGSPWQVRRKDNSEEILDIRQWEPVDNQTVDALKAQEGLSYAS